MACGLVVRPLLGSYFHPSYCLVTGPSRGGGKPLWDWDEAHNRMSLGVSDVKEFLHRYD